MSIPEVSGSIHLHFIVEWDDFDTKAGPCLYQRSVLQYSSINLHFTVGLDDFKIKVWSCSLFIPEINGSLFI